MRLAIRVVGHAVLALGLAASGSADHSEVLQGRDPARHTSIDASPEPIVSTWLRPERVPALGISGVTSGLNAVFLTTNEDPEGDMPRELALTPDGSTAVIANRDTDTVTFFDIDSRTITHTVDVGDFPVHVAITPDGQYALVPNVFDDSVSIIDIASHTVAAEVPITGEQPYRIAVTSDSQTAVVGVINDATNSSFSIVDLDTFTETMSFGSASQGVFGGFFTPESGIFGNIFTQFALSPDDMILVLPDRGNEQVIIYDIITGNEIDTLATAGLPTSVDISSDGATAVISHEGGERTITEIDLTTPAVTGEFTTNDDLFNQIVRITPDKSHAIAAILNNVIFIDLTTGATTATLSTGSVGDIEISFDGQYAFISNTNARVIDVAGQTIVDTITFAPCAEAVASPTELRAIALNNRFREDVQVYNIDGASGFAEGRALSGEPEEGDATRTLAVTPDGAKTLAVHNTSDNAAIIDTLSQSVLAYVSTGERSLGVAITPDGSTAVVANAEDDTTSIIDLTTHETVAQLATPTRPAEVAVSPDGQQAFITSVAGADRIWFIELDGKNSQVTGSIIAGQMGSIVYTYGVLSGITVSPDGSILAACISFDDELLLVDTTSQSEIVRVPVGDFPIRAAFSPDGSFAYVTHSFGDDVDVVEIDGANSQVVATVSGIVFPLGVVVDETGDFVYVGSFDLNTPSIKVIDTSTNTVVATVGLNGRPRSMHLSTGDSTLYVTTTEAELVRIDAAGAGSSIIDTTALTSGPSDLAFAGASQQAVIAQPIPDGVDIVDLATEADLTDLTIVEGTLIDGSLDDLLESDDEYVQIRSEPGFTAFEPNLVDAVIGAETQVASPELLGASAETRINNPVGTLKMRLKNWSTDNFDEIDTFTIGFDEETFAIGGIDAMNYVRDADGRIEYSLRYVVVATLTAQGFDSFIDFTRITAQE